MNKNRLEAFSDGVLAIVITIMVLEIKVPHGSSFGNLYPLIPKFLSYVLSFYFIGLYWNNHHHLFQAVKHVNGKILWANTHLLFWLSLIPFTTAWMGENNFAATPVILYGIVLLLAGTAYFILTKALVTHHGNDSTIAKAVGKGIKEKLSLIIYAIALAVAYFSPYFACILYILVALMWLIPDRRIEKIITR